MFSQGYIIDSQICIVLLWLFYVTLLRRRVSHTAARVYLLGVLPVGMLLAALKIPLLPAVEPTSSLSLFDTDITVSVVQPVAEVPQDMGLSLWVWLYVAGAALMLGFIIINLVRLFVERRRANGRRIVFVSGGTSGDAPTAYSAFGTIFIDNRWEGSPMLNPIVAHEQCHLDRGHSIDLLIMNILRSLLWFNPVSWHLTAMLREVHEFEADSAVLHSGCPAQDYLAMLLSVESGIVSSHKISFSLTNNFSYSLTKKRLVMIAQPTRSGLWRLLLALPLVGLMFTSFSLTAKPVDSTPQKDSSDYQSFMETSTATPLFVVDGEIKSKTEFQALTPENFSDIVVIKGTKAVGLFGEKGANGVILGTLKKPEERVFNLDLDVVPLPQGSADTTKHIQIGRGPKNSLTLRGTPKDSTDKKNAPALVFKGVFISQSEAEKLDMNDVKSITVLKGEAAKSAYGDKGVNGVVVITPKDDNAPVDTEVPTEVTPVVNLDLEVVNVDILPSSDTKDMSAKKQSRKRPSSNGKQ